MLQLPAIIILSFAVLVGRVCPVLQKEGHNSTTTEVTTNAENATDITIGSGAKLTNETSVKQPNNEAVKLNETTSGALSDHLPPDSDANLPAVRNEHDRRKQNCNSTKEPEDMLNCYVHPTDDDDDKDDEIVEKASPSNTTVPTIPANEDSVNNTKSSPKKVNPESTTEKSMTDITETIVTPLQNNTYYETVAGSTNHSTNASIKGTETESVTKHTESVISSVAPLLADKVRNKESDGTNEAEKSSDENNEKGMPSGIIALVITISFAITIVIAYIGMIAWRRYIEYRYGHRELLVNELEFDTNDLRHFEL